jgi:hypothetical protein
VITVLLGLSSALSSPAFAVCAVILGMVWLHERPARHQRAGIACTVAAG